MGGFLFNLADSCRDEFPFQLQDVWEAAGATPSDMLVWGTGGALYAVITGAALLWLLRARTR